MMFSVFTFFLTLVAFNTVLLVDAGIYVVNPRRGSTCQGGKPCTVDWLDDGQSPLLSAIGVATVGLYTGNQHLVQTIEPVDVSKVHSLTFTPLPHAGPNSGAYYISFASTTLKQNNSLPYMAFSPFFQLNRMTGSFSQPDPNATSSIPVPSSVVKDTKTTDGNPILTTITVGALATTSASATTLTASSFSDASHSPSPTSKGATTTIASSVTATPTSPARVSKSSNSKFSTVSSSSANSTTSTLSSTASSSSASPSSSSTTAASKKSGAAGVVGHPFKSIGFGVVFGLIHLALLL